MIKNKSDLHYYLKQDAKLYPKRSGSWSKKAINTLVTNPINTQGKIYAYVKNLRYAEYHFNNSILNSDKSIVAFYHTLMMLYFFYKLRRNSYQTGLQIPPNTCGPGLQIWHYGFIIINQDVRIGENVTLYPGVEIGEKNGEVPEIGSNVFIGAGAKIFGKIRIGDNVTVAPNAVVIQDVPGGAIVGGVPARILKMVK